MALPPEPLAELLKDATLVVDAQVLEVLETGAKPDQPQAPAGSTSVGYKSASQVVVLQVNKALKGQGAGKVTVSKPVGSYALKVGNKGAFFLKEGTPHMEILGRYGPDTHPLPAVEYALSKK
jgi:hypothetical protein